MKKQAKTISILELLEEFSTEAKAVNWLEKTMWGDTPVCPHCNKTKNITTYKSKKYSYWHKDCRKAFTIKTNTIMHASNIAAKKWVVAIYYILTARKGISSLQLSKELGITQKSAWFMSQRIREACIQGTFKLHKVVEVDETYIGGKEQNKHTNKKIKHSQGGANKSIVFGMRQRQGKVKAQVIPNTTSKTLQGVLSNNVQRDTLLCTDELRGYKGVDYNRVQGG